MWRERLALFLLSALLSIPALGKQHCEMGLYAHLPVTMWHGMPMIKGTINGKPATFRFTTGDFLALSLIIVPRSSG